MADLRFDPFPRLVLTVLKNPISLFSFRFPPVERGASSDGRIKEEGEEEGG